MLKIGITGGIGSGKSTVAAVFSVLGIPVYHADTEARRLMEEDPGLRRSIAEAFGTEAYRDGRLDRAWLAARVFSDPESTRTINAIVHPVTIRHALEWMERQQAPYALKEAALIFESGGGQALDSVIGVYAPLETRIRRVMERDGLPRERVLDRISRQMDEDEKMRRCDFVVRNDGSEMVIPQVLSIHARLLEKAAETEPNA